ncbi:OmpA family protein [Kytococcus sedentarius]|uniref:OmpA family protein n=1 Tax=Kytococcus sedentarius TaxID=1276 RepID=UPI00194F86E2|nr:OmpA family protein [Kytococcus sedentarius]QRO87528.1 OmpA family protein [Kytococcus sedentarius]
MSDNWGEDDRLEARDGDGVDRYDIGDEDHEEWYEVSRRYRRGLGGWWWLALLAIPLLLALLGMLFGGDDEGEGDGDASSSTNSGNASSSNSAEAPSAAAVSYTGGADEVSFSATAPSEADRDALVKAVEDANEGKTVTSEVSVDESAPLVAGPALQALTAALTAGGDDLSISGDAEALTLSGEVADAATKKKVASELAKVYPDAEITNELTAAAGGGGKSPSAKPSASSPAESSPAESSPAAPSPSASSPAPSPSTTSEPSPSATSEPAPSTTPAPSTSATSEPAPSVTSQPTKTPDPSRTDEPGPDPSVDPGLAAVNKIEDLTCKNAPASMKGISAAYPMRFPSSSDALYGESAVNAARIGEKLAGCDFDVVVVGHTDSVGGEVNERLSAFRAEKVAQALVVAGVDFDRIQQSNASASQPIASNETEDGRAKNRRVEILVK